MYHYHGKLLHADPSTCTSHVNRKYVLRSDKMRWATSEQHLGKKSCSLRATFSKFRSNFLSFTCRQACLRLWRDFLYTRRMMVGSVVFWSPMVGRWDPFKAWPLSAVIANTSIIESVHLRHGNSQLLARGKFKQQNLRVKTWGIQIIISTEMLQKKFLLRDEHSPSEYYFPDEEFCGRNCLGPGDLMTPWKFFNGPRSHSTSDEKTYRFTRREGCFSESIFSAFRLIL